MCAVVVGAREERVESSEEALNLLFAGNTSRVTEATEMNRRSSRSHAIFTVFVGTMDCLYIYAAAILHVLLATIVR